MRRGFRTSVVAGVLAALAATGVPSAAFAHGVPVPARVRAVSALPSPQPCPGCWAPPLEVSWQWQLKAPPAARDLLSVDMYDVDGFESSRRLVGAMHDRGIRAVCYVSAGSWEAWRPDAGRFPDEVLGRSNGWPGERWLDVRRLDVLGPIMRRRIAMCARKGFDGIEFDNVDGYQNRTGFPLGGADQLRFNVFLANRAHRRGLTAFLKNDLGQVRALLPYFDAALNEQCHRYAECGRLEPFVEAGKPVFGVEYGLEVGEFCPEANARNFNFSKKRLALDAWREPCRGV